MQCGIAEDRVELAGELEVLAAGDAGVEPVPPCRRNLLRARIDADDVAAEAGEFERQRTIAATEVKDALTRLGREQLDDGRAELGDEAGVLGIAIRVPRLGGHNRW